MIGDNLTRMIETIISLLQSILSKVSGSSVEDLIIRYPTNSAEMSVPADTTLKPVSKTLNRKLRSITISVPATGIMKVYNNGTQLFYFCDEAGTIEYPNGVTINDLEIEITNTDADNPARFTYILVFG